MALATAWFLPLPALVTAWIGPDGALEKVIAQARHDDALPELIGIPGPAGSPGPQGPEIDIFTLPLAP